MAANPTWLDEAYASPIAALDIGLLDRCVLLSHITAAVLKAQRLRRGPFLDWAGGYGTLTRLMRDRGYPFEHSDPYTQNIFAVGHEAGDVESSRFELITAFEVLEHLVDPVGELATVAGATDLFLTTTHVLPEPAPKPGEWWYYTPETGQHMTLYTPKSLEILADRLGFDGVVTGPFVHLFYRGTKPSALTSALVRRPAFSYGIGLLASVPDRRHSLQASDLEEVKQRLQVSAKQAR